MPGEKKITEEQTPLTSEEQIAKLTAQLAEQNKTSEAQSALIQGLTEKFAGLEKSVSTEAKDELPTIPKDLVSIGGEKYKWAVPAFKMPGSGEIVTAEEANTDEVLLAKILEIEGQGLLILQA